MKKIIIAILVTALCGVALLYVYILGGEKIKQKTKIDDSTAITETSSVTENKTETTKEDSESLTRIETEETTEESTTVTETEEETTVPDTTEADTTTAEKQTTTENGSTEPKVVITKNGIEYHADISKYIDFLDPKDNSPYLLLANKTHVLASDYVPSDLRNSGSGTKNCKLDRYACNAYLALMAEMKAYGISTKCQSGYRSYAEQSGIYNKYIKSEKSSHPTYTDEQIIALVDTYSAFPGSSEHQTGLAIDFYPIKNSFEKTAAFKFLDENGWKFGFILRYGKEQSEITGYMYEPWHWRFIGITAAKYIHEHGITLEEYLEEMDIMPEANYPKTEETTQLPPE